MKIVVLLLSIILIICGLSIALYPGKQGANRRFWGLKGAIAGIGILIFTFIFY